MGAIAGIAGAALIAGGATAGILGGKTYPQYTPISYGQQQKQAIQNNLNILPSAEQLGSQVNQFNASQMSSLLNEALPFYKDMSASIMGTIDQELAGKVPTDVQANIQDSDAARALTGGFGGTGLAGNVTARDLGLTSLDLTGKGLSSAESWIQQSAALLDPHSFDLTSMFVTPQQNAAFTAGQANLLQQNKMGFYGVPSTLSKVGSAMSSVGGMLVGAAAGGGGGGGGGGMMSMMGGMGGGGGGSSGGGGGDISNDYGDLESQIMMSSLYNNNMNAGDDYVGM